MKMYLKIVSLMLNIAIPGLQAAEQGYGQGGAGVQNPQQPAIYFNFSNNPQLDSNFPTIIVDGFGRQWPSAQHYYEAMKFINRPDIQTQLLTMPDARAAQNFARTQAPQPASEQERYQNMYQAQSQKFSQPQNAALKTLLLNTGNSQLYYYDTDTFWGTGPQYNGTNWLGKILMQVRDQLRQELQQQQMQASQAAMPAQPLAASQIQQQIQPAIDLLPQFPQWSQEVLEQNIDLTTAILQSKGGPFQALTIPHNSRVLVIGDTHACCNELIATINLMRQNGHFKQTNPWELQDNDYLIFTGDLTDRGPNGVGVWQIAMMLKRNNPDRCFILRGNHETYEIAASYGFADELRTKYNFSDKFTSLVPAKILNLFNALPAVLFLGFNQPNSPTVFGMFCHGGFDPNVAPQAIQNMIGQAAAQPGTLITRQATEILSSQQVIDNLGILWTDFAINVHTNQYNPGSRIHGYTVHPDFAAHLLHQYSTQMSPVLFIVRAHQHNPNCVSVLNKYTGTWYQLSAPLPITQPDRFIFTCMNLGPEAMQGDPRYHAGYGLIMYDAQNTLTITPYASK